MSVTTFLKLRLERVGQLALLVEAGNAGDEQEVADLGGKGERRGFDAGWRWEMLDGHGTFQCNYSISLRCSPHERKRHAGSLLSMSDEN